MFYANISELSTTKLNANKQDGHLYSDDGHGRNLGEITAIYAFHLCEQYRDCGVQSPRRIAGEGVEDGYV